MPNTFNIRQRITKYYEFQYLAGFFGTRDHFTIYKANVECRLSCCPIPLSRFRFFSFLKLMSYRHTHILALKTACEEILTHF